MTVAPLPSNHPYANRPLSSRNIRDRLDQLTHRHLFLRSLLPSISDLDYGFLVPGNASVSLLGAQNEIPLLINPMELEDWISVCKASPFVGEFRKQKVGPDTCLKLRFHDQSELCLRLVTQFRYHKRTFLNAALVLEKVLIHRDGIKIANACHVVEYHWLRSHTENRKFPIDFRPLLLVRPTQEQTEVAEYLCHKFRLESHRLYHLLTHTPNFRNAIDRRMGLRQQGKKTHSLKDSLTGIVMVAGLRLFLS